MDETEQFRLYQKFDYQTGVVKKGRDLPIDEKIIKKEAQNDFNLTFNPNEPF